MSVPHDEPTCGTLNHFRIGSSLEKREGDVAKLGHVCEAGRGVATRRVIVHSKAPLRIPPRLTLHRERREEGEVRQHSFRQG